LCSSCEKKPYTHVKKDFCEACGFPGQRAQLDVDHVDGDKANDDPSNLQTLCANCHRLKTHKGAGWEEHIQHYWRKEDGQR
jgi:RecJ-like exonuclease